MSLVKQFNDGKLENALRMALHNKVHMVNGIPVKPCKWHLNGRCTFGKKCKNYHISLGGKHKGDIPCLFNLLAKGGCKNPSHCQHPHFKSAAI